VIETEIYDWRRRGIFFFFLVSSELMLYFLVGEVSWLEYGSSKYMPSKMTAMPVERGETMSIRIQSMVQL
jgi:hypothetical protein